MKNSKRFKRAFVAVVAAAMFLCVFGLTTHAADIAASVGETDYTDFPSALAAAQAADKSVLTLKSDVDAKASAITISAGDFTLDLNGKTLTVAHPITVTGSAKLTILDSAGDNSGKITNESTADVSPLIQLDKSATMTLKSGSVINQSSGGDGIVNTGNLYVQGGFIRGYGYFIRNFNGFTEISGGSFRGRTYSSQGVNTMFADGLIFFDGSKNPVIIDDYYNELGSGTYSVGERPLVYVSASGDHYFADFEKALTFINEHSYPYKIKLMDNITTEKTFTYESSNKSITLTLDLAGFTLTGGTETVISIAEGRIFAIDDTSTAKTGKIISQASSEKPTILNNGSLTVTNGSIDGTTGPAIVNNSGSTGVTGGIVKGAWGIINSGKTLNLSGGSVIGTQNPAVTMISGTLNLKGGTLNEAGSTTTGLCICPKTAADVTAAWTSGTIFNGIKCQSFDGSGDPVFFISDINVAQNNAILQNDTTNIDPALIDRSTKELTGKLTLVKLPVAMVTYGNNDPKYFTDLEEAFDSLLRVYTLATVTLLRDVEVDIYLQNLTNVVFDLNGHTVTSDERSGYATVEVGGRCQKLVICDSSPAKTGSIICTGSGSGLEVSIDENATLESGHISSVDNYGNFYMTGGSIGSLSNEYHLSVAQLSGGWIKNGIVMNYRGKVVADMLAPGYQFYRNGTDLVTNTQNQKLSETPGNYMISSGPAAVVKTASYAKTNYMSLEEAFKSASENSNSTLTLLQDVTLTSTIAITDANFTIEMNGKTITSSADPAFRITGESTSVRIDGIIAESVLEPTIDTGYITCSSGCALSVEAGRFRIDGMIEISGKTGVSVSDGAELWAYNGVIKGSETGLVNSGKAIIGYAYSTPPVPAVVTGKNGIVNIAGANLSLDCATIAAEECAVKNYGKLSTKSASMEGGTAAFHDARNAESTDEVNISKASFFGEIRADNFALTDLIPTGHAFFDEKLINDLSDDVRITLTKGQQVIPGNQTSRYYVAAVNVAMIEADGEVQYRTDFASALNLATNLAGSTLTLLEDIDLGTAVMEISDKAIITFDLNGCEITSDADITVDIADGAVFTITDSASGGKISGKTAVKNAGSLTIEDGEISGDIALDDNRTSGTVVISGGTFSGRIKTTATVASLLAENFAFYPVSGAAITKEQLGSAAELEADAFTAYDMLTTKKITGTIKSYGSAADPVTIRLLDSNGTELDSIETTDTTFTLTVPFTGTYTLEVSKPKHVTRTYTITLEP